MRRMLVLVGVLGSLLAAAPAQAAAPGTVSWLSRVGLNGAGSNGGSAVFARPSGDGTKVVFSTADALLTCQVRNANSGEQSRPHRPYNCYKVVTKSVPLISSAPSAGPTAVTLAAPSDPEPDPEYEERGRNP